MKRSGVLLVCFLFGVAAGVGAQNFQLNMTGTLVSGEVAAVHLSSGDKIEQFAGTGIVLSADDDASFEAGDAVTASVAGDTAGTFTLRLATLVLETNASGHLGDGYSVGTFTLTSPTSGTTSGLFVSDIGDFANLAGYAVADPTQGTGSFTGKTFLATMTATYSGTGLSSFSGTLAGTTFETAIFEVKDNCETAESTSAETRLFDLASSTSILQFVPPTGTSSFDLHTTTSPNMQLEVGLEHAGYVLGSGESPLPGALNFGSTAYIVRDPLSRQYGQGFAVGPFSFVDGFGRGRIEGFMVADVSPGDATYPVKTSGYLFATRATNTFEPFFMVGTVAGGYYDASGLGSLDGFAGDIDALVYLGPGNAAYTFESGTEGWTSGGAPAVFTMPDTDYFDGELHLIAKDNTNTFGFWQTPPTAIPKTDRDLIHAMFEVSSNLVNKAIMPTLRLRVAEANNQSASVLSVESIGAAQSSPDIAGAIYHNYFRPPAATSTTLYLAFDMLNFSPDDASYAWLSLDTVVVERIVLPGEFTFSDVTSYDFNTGQQGWEFVSVPAVFAPPTSDVSGGALALTTTTNTNTFGYWASPVIAVEGSYLYRVRYEVTTNITAQSVVPTLRLRINTNNLQESEMLVIESSGAGESSPLAGSVAGASVDPWREPFLPARTGGQKEMLGAGGAPEYEVYFIPPESALSGTDAGIRLAFDVLNFNPADAATGSLYLDGVEISRAPLTQ
jgi:hypothetical protein